MDVKIPKESTLAGRCKRWNNETKANKSNSQATEFSMNFCME